MGNRSKNGTVKGRKLLLAAVCASLTPSTSAFTVSGPGRQPLHLVSGASSLQQNDSTSTSPPSSALRSSPNDDVHFFTAATQPSDDESDEKTNTRTISESSNGMVSTEQAELESMKVAKTKTEEKEDLLSTTSVAAAAAASSIAVAAPKTAIFMDVDGNGTGALMKRSPAAGGADAPLMATNPSLAFPIDSGKEGLQAETTRDRTRKSLVDEIIDRARPKTRLVRHSLPPSESSKQGPNKKSLAPASATSKTGMIELTRPQSQKPDPRLQPPKTKLVRFNGPDVEDSTDYEGMELASVKRNRDRQLKLQRANLVRYKGVSHQKQLTEEVANHNSDIDGSGTEDDHQRNRKNLVEDPGYANRYTGLSDFNLARKTGLIVNKPISLWVERDKFL